MSRLAPGPLSRSRVARGVRRSVRRSSSRPAPRAQGPPRPRPSRDDARLPPETQEAARDRARARPFMGERRRLRVTAECSRGAYGIRTRATAVRGRRPRPLDECAVPGQSSRSLERFASERERSGRIRSEGRRRPGVLRPERRSLPIVPESSRRAPLTRRVPKALGNDPLISHAGLGRQRVRGRGFT